MKLIRLPLTKDYKVLYVNPEYITHVSEFNYMGQTQVSVGVMAAHGGLGNGYTFEFEMSAPEFLRRIGVNPV